jgi:Ran-binding protein 3
MANHETKEVPPDSSPSSSVVSDNDGGEKPVREQLKKASIDENTLAKSAAGIEPVGESKTSSIQPTEHLKPLETSPKLRRKRSIEDVERDVSEDENGHIAKGRHSRKRSRDLAESSGDNSTYEASGPKSDASSEMDNARGGTPGKGEKIKGPERVTSPKGKRNREQFLKDDVDVQTQSLNGAAVPSGDDKEAKKEEPAEVTEGRDPKRQRDDETKTEKKETKESAKVGRFSCISPYFI